MYRIDRMRKDYERFTAAEGYIIGFSHDGKVYGVEFNKIPRRFVKVQRESSSCGGGYGLYVKVSSKKAIMELLPKATLYGSTEELIDPNGVWNKGVMFEKMVWEHNGMEFRGKDRVPFYESGDITIDGKEIQVKYLYARICYDRTLTKLKKGA